MAEKEEDFGSVENENNQVPPRGQTTEEHPEVSPPPPLMEPEREIENADTPVDREDTQTPKEPVTTLESDSSPTFDELSTEAAPAEEPGSSEVQDSVVGQNVQAAIEVEGASPLKRSAQATEEDSSSGAVASSEVASESEEDKTGLSDSPSPDTGVQIRSVETDVTDSQPKDSESGTADSEPGDPELSTRPQSKTTEESTAESASSEAVDQSMKGEGQEQEEGKEEDTEQDYESMNMENLVGELQRLLRTSSISTIAKQVNRIRNAFDHQYQEQLEEKKEEYVNNGGNEIDFRFQSVAKRQFNELMREYREKRDQHYKQVELELKKNHEDRLEIIEELKSLINVEEDLHHTYKHFKEIQEKWRNAGPVPRTVYNDLMQTYHHHTEIFYDFLHLNRELRDLDFQHNLEEKEKLITRAEELKDEPDLNKALFELQILHRVWKEDVGPVAKEKREDVWSRFSEATKVIHQRRQEHFKQLEEDQKINLEKKKDLISRIQQIAENVEQDHRELQKQIRQIEKLREEFMAMGRVPKTKRDQTWSEFKEAVRSFNRRKNALYKDLKNSQLENLQKKRALIERAVALKDSDDHEVVTPEMKRIQNEWKKIGHVPRKYSDKIWKEFKAACNEYFDRIHSEKKKEKQEEVDNFRNKKEILDRIRSWELSGEKDKDVKEVKSFISEWKKIGRVPVNKKDVNDQFNAEVDRIFTQLGIDRKQSEILKYGDKLEELSASNDIKSVMQERSFIRRKIEECRQEIRQLETNMEFFSSSSGKTNPLLAQVEKNISKQKEVLGVWEAKLKNVNILQHKLKKQAEQEESGDESAEEPGSGENQ